MRIFVCLVLAVVSLASAQALAPQEGVFYEIFLRSFQDSDGDGVGDLRGATERLEYLDELGITGIWLMPFHPSPSYHGYDVTDYYDINPDYGTLEDFDAFVAAAHGRGMSVVMDLVVNHSSDRHPWFLKARQGDETYHDYYVWSDEDVGWRGTSGASAWHETDGGYYLGLFWSRMPDLNYQNPAVVAQMEDVAKFWLERGVDGFRVDAIQHVVEGADGTIRNTPANLEWVRGFEAFIKTVDPEAFVVGETWTDTGTIVKYHEEADLDLSFNYPLWGALLDAVQSRSAANLALTLAQDERFYPEAARRATFISNHDQIRPATSLGLLRRDEARLKMAAGLLLTLPGTPFIYYGEEIGLPNGPGDKDEEKRSPMRWNPGEVFTGFSSVEPWHAFSTDAPAISVAAQLSAPDSLLTWYRSLIALRVANPALFEGATEVLETEDRGLLGLLRSTEGQRVLVLANLNNGETEYSLPESATDLLSGEAVSGALLLSPMSLRVLEFSD